VDWVHAPRTGGQLWLMIDHRQGSGGGLARALAVQCYMACDPAAERKMERVKVRSSSRASLASRVSECGQ
jgi:hypothetical protein